MMQKVAYLCDACYKGDAKRVRRVIESRANVNVPFEGLKTPLMFASRGGSVPCVELLLDNDADVLAQDSEGESALSCAIMTNNFPIVKVLLKHGADVEARFRGRTALHCVCEARDLKCMDLLLKRNADVHARGDSGETALMIATQSRNSQGVQLLLENGANANDEDVTGKTSLMSSSMLGDVKSVELLLKYRADVHAESSDGGHALGFAGFHCHLECMHLLLQAKADPNASRMSLIDLVLQARVPPSQRSTGAFLLMCNDQILELSIATASEELDRVREDYRRIHAQVNQRHRELVEVLDTSVVVDTRLHRMENGIYHEPLEQVLAYCGMLLQPRVVNVHEDDKIRGGHVLLTESYEAIRMAFGGPLPYSKPVQSKRQKKKKNKKKKKKKLVIKTLSLSSLLFPP